MSSVSVPTTVHVGVAVITYSPERLLMPTTSSEEELLAISESVDASLFVLPSSVAMYSCSIILSPTVTLGEESGGSADVRQVKGHVPGYNEGGCVAVWLGLLSQPVLTTDSVSR